MLLGKDTPVESEQSHAKSNRLPFGLIFIQYYIKNIAYVLSSEKRVLIMYLASIYLILVLKNKIPEY